MVLLVGDGGHLRLLLLALTHRENIGVGLLLRREGRQQRASYVDTLQSSIARQAFLYHEMVGKGGSAILCSYGNGIGIGRLIEGVCHLLRFLCAYPREGIVGRCHLNGLVCHRGQEVGIHHAIQ